MLFKRRKEDGFWTRLRVFIWPRRNHARSTRYVWKRVLRIRATPSAIAIGFASGVFASFTPFMGFHFVLSFALAWVTRASFIAAGLGTAIGNPLTFPFIFAGTHGLGSRMLGRTKYSEVEAKGFLETLKSDGFAAVWDPFVLPMAVGGIPMGMLAGLLFYFPVKKAAAAFQSRKNAKRLENEKVREAKAAAAQSASISQ